MPQQTRNTAAMTTDLAPGQTAASRGAVETRIADRVLANHGA